MKNGISFNNHSTGDDYTSTWQNDGQVKFVQLKNGDTLRYLEIGNGDRDKFLAKFLTFRREEE